MGHIWCEEFLCLVPIDKFSTGLTETSYITTLSPTQLPTHPAPHQPWQIYLSHFYTTCEAEILYGSFIQPN